MSNNSNPIILDASIVFFDNVNVNYINRQKDTNSIINFVNTWFYDIDQNNIQEKYNYFNNNTFFINFFVGLDSTYCKNNILNSKLYLKDEKVSSRQLTPFKEDKYKKLNSLETNLNPYVLVETYGQGNPDELFEIISNIPFEDTDNIENVNEFLEMPTKIKYPKYYNYYSLSRLNSNISVFGTIEEIDGSLLTERSLLGLKCELVSAGVDPRGRANSFSSNITLLELSENKKSSLESYSDEEYTGLVTGNDELLKRSFAYTTKIINGQVVTVFDTSENASSIVSTVSNKVLFFTEDDSNILPFRDRNIISEDNVNSNNSERVNNDGSVYPSHGHDHDNSQISGPESIAYSGEHN